MLKTTTIALTIASLLIGQAAIAKTTDKDMATTFKKSNKFSYLADSLRRVGKTKQLHGAGPFTFFVPKNDAFDDMSYGKWVELWNDKPQLNRVLSRGLVEGKHDAASFAGGATLRTIDGGTLKIELKDKDLYIGDTKIKDTDIQCSNGVVHILDGFIGKNADPPAVKESTK
ncbi:MAG: fasciclin domain-containing protein [Candidatus Obscuribacterales bacterium]|jgi:uncharacterized surface protein with fasciclin (FAS1) repeats